jgi:hypothetical protein
MNAVNFINHINALYIRFMYVNNFIDMINQSILVVNTVNNLHRLLEDREY